MTFCPQCGRARAGDARFCGTCGHEFTQRAAGPGPATPVTPGEPTGSGEPTATVRPEQIRWDAPVAPPGRNAPAGVAHPETVAGWDAPPGVAYPETVAGWNSPPAADAETPPPGKPANEPAAEPASPWAGWENTVTSGPAQAAGYAAEYAPAAPPAHYVPPTAADPVFPPPQSPASPPHWPLPPRSPSPAPQSPLPPQSSWTDDQGQRPERRMTWIFVLIAVIVVLGAGAGAYALTRSQRPTTPLATQSTGTAATSAAAATTSAAPTPSDSASPSASASPSPSPTPSPTHTGAVQVAAAAANDPAEPQVLAYVNRYFAAINAHDYNAYYSLLDAQEQAGMSQASFDSGYATTKDSNEVLAGIEDAGGGDVTADLSFTSRQKPSSSVDGSACNTWQISLYLVPQGSSYVQTSPPSSYHSTHGDC